MGGYKNLKFKEFKKSNIHKGKKGKKKKIEKE